MKSILLCDTECSASFDLVESLRAHGCHVTRSSTLQLEITDFDIVIVTNRIDGVISCVADARKRSESVPVFVICGAESFTDEYVYESYHAGADLVLREPLNPDDLVSFK